MKFIKILNENLGAINISDYQEELDNANNNKDIANIIKAQLDEWDANNICKDFRFTLQSRISSKGWDANDPLLKWLQNSDDKNIKALDNQSSTHLIDLLDDDKLEPDNKYIIDGNNNLFTGSSNDIIFKLNVLSILLDPTEASKYSNDQGNVPTVDLILDSSGNSFLSTKEIKQKMDLFSTSNTEDEDEYMDFITWALTKAEEDRAQKGKEFNLLFQKLKEKGREQKNSEYKLVASDLKALLGPPKNNSALNTLNKHPKSQIPKDTVKCDDVLEIMKNALKEKVFDVSKGINILIAISSLSSKFTSAVLTQHPKKAVEAAKIFLDRSNNGKSYAYALKQIFEKDPNLWDIFTQLTVKDTQVATVTEKIIKFIDKYPQYLPQNSSNESDNTQTA